MSTTRNGKAKKRLHQQASTPPNGIDPQQVADGMQESLSQEPEMSPDTAAVIFGEDADDMIEQLNPAAEIDKSFKDASQEILENVCESLGLPKEIMGDGAVPAQQQENDGDEKRGPGRPPGSKNLDYEVVTAISPCCKKCRSTKFGPRRPNPRTFDYSGIENGQVYNRIVWYNTKCLDCGQAITVRELQYHPEPSEEAGYEEPSNDPSDAE